MSIKNITQIFPLHSSSRFAHWRMLSLILFGVMLGSLLLSFYFVYNYVYRTIDAADAVVSLNSSLNDTLDIATFSKFETALTLKQQLASSTITLRYPFSYADNDVSTSSPRSSSTIVNKLNTRPSH